VREVRKAANHTLENERSFFTMTPTQAIDNQLARLRMRYARTPLPRFFAWWGRELVSLLPARWRALLAERAEALLLEIRGDQLAIWRQTGNACVEAAVVALDAGDAERKAAIERVRALVDDPNLRTFYCIAPGRALRREFTLPVAAENNLRQVLAFEMDRQTPFKADQVYFDYHLGQRDPAAKNLQITLIVVPRAPLDADLAKLSAGALRLDGVDCWRDGPGSGRMGLNLLPAERRPRRVNPRLRLNLGLAAGAVVLLITVMLLSLANREAALAAMSSQVDKAQNAAKQVSTLKKTLIDSIAAANFLNCRKHETPVMVALVADLSQRLPDDTYLERLAIDEKYKIDVQGLSDNTTKLVEGLAQSEVVENPSFQGTIQQDPRTHKDRFNMSLEFRHKGDADCGKEHKPGKDSGPRKEGGSGHAPAAGSP
jgi:general secretion pathway protein L